MIEEDIIKTATIKNVRYNCPLHGEVSGALISTIPGLEMELCLTCYIEAMVNLGIQKLDRIDEQTQVL